LISVLAGASCCAETLAGAATAITARRDKAPGLRELKRIKNAPANATIRRCLLSQTFLADERLRQDCWLCGQFGRTVRRTEG
jgi:hypothetical protein